MHLPSFNQSFGNYLPQQHRGIGGSENRQRGIGGSHHQPSRGIGGSINQPSGGIEGSNTQRSRGIEGSNNQQSRGIGGNTQQPRGIVGNQQRGIGDRRMDGGHTKLHDSISSSDLPIRESRSSRLMMFLRAKKWHILILVLFVLAVTMTTWALVWREDDSTQESGDASNVGGTAPTLAPVASEGAEIPTTGTVEPATGDPQPNIQPMASPTRPPLLFPENENELVLNEVGEVFGSPFDSGVISMASALSGDGYTVAVLKRTPDGSSNVQVGVHRYAADLGSWEKLGEDIVGDGDVSINGVGQSLALSEDGNTLAVGFFNAACDLGENCGRVRILSFEEGGWRQIGQDFVGEQQNVYLGWSVAISNDGLTVAAGEPFSGSADGSRVHLGKVKVLRIDSDGNWTSTGTDMEGGSDRDQFGTSVALSADGSIVACTAPKVQNGGYVKISQFNESTGSFVQLGSDIVGDEKIAQFGVSVALSDSGLIVAVGGLGIVSVYTLKDAAWIKVGEDIESETPRDMFGYSVALNADGSRLVIGAPESESQTGTALLFEHGERGWLQRGELIVAKHDGGQLGRSVSLDSSGFVVAAGGHFGVQIYYDSGIQESVSHVGGFTHLGAVIGSGALPIASAVSGNGTTAAVVTNTTETETSRRMRASGRRAQIKDQVIICVFRYNSTGDWAKLGDDLVFLVGTGDIIALRKSLALSENGNNLVIGFFSESCGDLGENCGRVHVFSYESGTWSQLGEGINGTVSNGFLGWSVAISDDGLTVAAGAPQSPGDGGLDRAGKVRVFRLENAQWEQVGPDLEGGGALDQLGGDLALSGDGSYLAASAVQGQTASLGYVKVFKFDAGTDTFVQVGEIIEGDNRTNKFGTSVSLSDDGLTLAVGATVGEAESDEAVVARAESFGLVYVFRNDNSTWSKLGNDIESGKTGDLFGFSVAISADGNAVIAGAPEDYSNSGSAYVYFLDEVKGTWVQYGDPIFPIENEGSQSQLGRSVAISSAGDLVAAGGRNGIQVYQIDFPVDDSPAASPSSPFASPSSVGVAPSSPNASPVAMTVAPEIVTQLGEVIGGEADATVFSSTISRDGTTTAVALRTNPDVVRVSVYRYDSSKAWNKLGGDVVGVGELDGVGKSLALSDDGNTLAIGFFDEACDLGENCGRVRVYTFDESGWIQRGEDIVGANALEFFGWTMAISNDGFTIAAGSALSHGENNKSHSGKVRVYRFENGAYRQLGGDLVGDGEWDHLGSSLSLSGDGNIVASGAVQGGEGKLGYVKIYKYNDSTGSFSQLGTNIIGDNRTDKFGDSVSLSETGIILAVGATKGGSGEDNDTEPSFGLVAVFRYEESGWSKVGTDVESGTTGDLFGFSVAINGAGDRILIGAPECDSLAGCAMVYDLDGTEAWTQLGETTRSASKDASLTNQLGRSVAISSSGAVFAAGGRAGVQVYQATPGIGDNAGVDDDKTQAVAAPASPVAPFASPASSPAGTPTGATAPYSPVARPTSPVAPFAGETPTPVGPTAETTLETTMPSASSATASPAGSPNTTFAPAGAPTSSAQTLEETPQPVVEDDTGETPAPQVQVTEETTPDPAFVPSAPYAPASPTGPTTPSAPATPAGSPITPFAPTGAPSSSSAQTLAKTREPVVEDDSGETPASATFPILSPAASPVVSPFEQPVGRPLERHASAPKEHV